MQMKHVNQSVMNAFKRCSWSIQRTHYVEMEGLEIKKDMKIMKERKNWNK